MKIRWDRTYLKYSFYVILTLVIAYFFKIVVDHIGELLHWLRFLILEILDILAPLIWGCVIAYLLYPVVRFFERRVQGVGNVLQINKLATDLNLQRVYAVIVTYLIVILLIVVTFNNVGPQLSQSYQRLLTNIPKYSYSIEYYYNQFYNANEQLNNSGLPEEVKLKIINTIESITNRFSKSMGAVADFIVKFFANLVDIFLSIIISFYLLKDLDFFKKSYSRLKRLTVPIDYQIQLDRIVIDINDVFQKFLRGQVVVGLIVGALSMASLLIIKVDFAVILGIFAGITNIIPYFGPFIGGVPAVIVGLLSGGIGKAVTVMILFTVIQQVESLFITPKIVGGEVGLHPLYVILSIIIGGSYFGIIGMILGVPVAALIRKLYNFILTNLEEKEIKPRCEE